MGWATRRRGSSPRKEPGSSSEALLQDVEVTHPVQRRDNRRLRTDSGGKVVDRRIQRVRFHAQQHGVIGRLDLTGGDELWPHRHIAVRADDLQPAFPELSRAPRTHQAGHVASGLRQPSAEISAGRTGSYNQKAHVMFSWRPISNRAIMPRFLALRYTPVRQTAPRVTRAAMMARSRLALPLIVPLHRSGAAYPRLRG